METIVQSSCTCEECGNTVFASDLETGDIACTRCGLLQPEKATRQSIPYNREKPTKEMLLNAEVPRCLLCNSPVTTSDVADKRYRRRKYCSKQCRKTAHYLLKARGWVPGTYRLFVREHTCPICGDEMLQTGLRKKLYDKPECARKAQNARYRYKHQRPANAVLNEPIVTPK